MRNLFLVLLFTAFSSVSLAQQEVLELGRADIRSGKMGMVAAAMQLAPAQKPWISNVTGDWIDPQRAADSEYWVEHLRRTVRFGGGVEALDLLSQVHDLRNEPELAAQASERAKSIREAQAGEG